MDGWHGTDSLWVLCERLRSEKLLVASELENLQRLNEQVDAEQTLLAQLSWTGTHQQEILSRLVNSHPSVIPENSCLLNAQLDCARFLEAYQRIDGHHYSTLCTAINLLLTSPRSVAELLHAAEHSAKEKEEVSESLVPCVFSFLYGCCVFPEDERCVLQVLSHLIELQLTSHSDPRLILRRGNAAFCRLYKLFTEGLFTAKVFLTAALHDPVMYVLSQDELFLDIDPSKSAIRFPPEERRRRFGDDEDSLGYLQRLTAHRKTIESKLIAISNRFVQGITQAMSCFPQSLAWLVRELHSTLVERNKVTAEQASLICTDLIFTCLICPAIANPETLGVISDTPITYIARFNLMQVGQIVQTLALVPFEQPHSHLAYFYSHFQQEPMAHVVQIVLQSTDSSLDAMFGRAEETQGCDQLSRRSFVGTLNEVNSLHTVLRSNAMERVSDANVRRELRTIVRRLPTHFDFPILRGGDSNTGQQTPSGTNRSPEHLLTDQTVSPPPSRSNTLRNFADRVQTAAQRSQQRLRNQHVSPTVDTTQQNGETDNIEVLVFPLGTNREPLGLCTEEKFMESVRQPLSLRKHKTSESAAEKRTRFLDTESIGNSDRATDAGSDDEEEGASLSSSIEGNPDQMEDDGEDVSTLPDNISDVGLISSNVSGRGSPSISGPPSVSDRGTPHSAHADTQPQEGVHVAKHEAATARRTHMPNLPSSVRRENSEGLEDKFGKFGLPQDSKHRYRDDAHSMVSDSWSTDVQPSDTEGLSMHDGAPPVPVLPVLAETGPVRAPSGRVNRLLATASGAASLGVPLSAEDRSDTWSVDAMASDSEADPVHRHDDLLLIEDSEQRADTASATSGGDNTPLLMSATSESSLAAGGASAASQAMHNIHPCDTHQHPTPTTNLPLSQHPTLQHPKRRTGPVDVSLFGEMAPENLLQGGSASTTVGEGNRGRIRRQSSGSSFYSKSDVDSEFSKDLNDDALSSLLGDYTPSFRNSIGEMVIATPSSPAASVLATAGSFCNDDLEGQSTAAVQLRERSLSPKQSSTSAQAHDETTTTQRSANETITMEKRREEGRDSHEGSNEDEIRARWASSGAMPKLVKTNNESVTHATPVVGPLPSGSGFARKKINIFQGLQKVGESLKMRKGMAVSSLRQSLSQATTMNELASINVQSKPTADTRRGVPQLDAAFSACRLTGSRSMGELGANRERSEHAANEILDKYKGKQATSFADTPSITATPATMSSSQLAAHQKDECLRTTVPITPYYDANNVTQCRAFVDAKRKLRLVLSSVGSCSVPASPNTLLTLGDHSAVDSLSAATHINRSTSHSEHLMDFLQILLAESINGHDKTLSAQIREVLRCLTAFDDKGVRKLLRTLKDEHRKRTAYLLYLQQSRLTLLQLRAYLEKLSGRVHREKSLTVECLVEVLVRFHLEQRDVFLRRFIHEFQLLKAQDERTDAVERTLALLYERMPTEAMWRDADAEMMAYARKSLERSLMAQIYVFAMYPNGEADQCRDSVFHKSLRKLATIITPDHPELRIPPRFHGECPWPSAQAEIAIINAYKSARDKMACVVRCCETIENLLLLAARHGTASADDITPLLVYVLIQANPQALLSNIQYVNGFYGSRMEGAEGYWWTQFTSAVEFIKTLLSRHF